MFKIVTVILITFLAFGCGDSKKKAERAKAEKAKDSVSSEQFTNNILNEPISLLAVKYEVLEDRLKQILTDYEMMVYGFSFVRSFNVGEQAKEGQVSKPVVDVNTALNRVSEKYGIDKKVLSALIIEWKIMEKMGRE